MKSQATQRVSLGQGSAPCGLCAVPSLLTDFVNSVIEAQLCLCVYTLSLAAFVLQEQG